MGTFAGTAGFYARFRPPYPDLLWSTLVAELRLDGTGRLLDLGTGPGVAAHALAGYVGSVVAVDPEPEMLAEARASGGDAVEWVLDAAETFDAAPGSLRAVVMGQSFHWMQRSLVLEQEWTVDMFVGFLQSTSWRPQEILGEAVRGLCRGPGSGHPGCAADGCLAAGDPVAGAARAQASIGRSQSLKHREVADVQRDKVGLNDLCGRGNAEVRNVYALMASSELASETACPG